MSFFSFLNPKNRAFVGPAVSLYRAAVAAARVPAFYAAYAVPDTPDGRFDMVALHVFLVLRRLRHENGEAALGTAQAITDQMFADMDRNLRELGVGDLGVGRQVKALAAAFAGRTQVYDAALRKPGDEDLTAAIRRNIFRGASIDENIPGIAAIAAYMRAADAVLAGQSALTILSGSVFFPSPPVG